MKSSAWDNKLWQNKMLEIPLEEDVNSAWADMERMLDDVMPVVPGPPAVKKLWGISRSMLLTIAYTAAAAAILIFATHYILKEHPHKTFKPNKENVKPIPGQPANKPGSGNKSDTGAITLPASGNKGDSLDATKTAATNGIANTVIPDNKNPNGANNAGSSLKQTNIAGAAQTKINNTLAANAKGKLVSPANNNTAHHTLQAQNAILQASSKVSGHGFNNRRSTRTNNTNAGLVSIPLFTNNHQNRPGDQNISKTNGLIKAPDAASNQKTNKPVNNASLVRSSKPDSAKAKSNKVNDTTKKPAANNAAGVKSKPAPATKPKSNKQAIYSKFELGIETGINPNKNSVAPFAGIFGSYAVNSKFSIGTGMQLFSTRIIDGSYTKNKYKYTITDDSGRTTNHTAKVVVNSSQKIYTIDIPVIASYRLTNWLSLRAGPVISIPVKTGVINNAPAPVGTTLDTARAYKTLLSKVNSTTINSNVNLSLSGGININLNRFYINAGYVQGLGAYTISSSLGTGNTYYHALQLGIGYKLFKSKPKSN